MSGYGSGPVLPRIVNPRGVASPSADAQVLGRQSAAEPQPPADDMDSVESRTRQAAIDFEMCLAGIAPDVDPEEVLDEEFLAEARGFIRRMLDQGKLENPDDWREALATMGSVEEFRRHWGGGGQGAENAADEPPPNWRDHSDDEDPATGWTQLEVAESQWAARTGKCCYVIADVGFDGPRKLCGHRVALGWIFCADHLEDISYGDPKTVDPERFRRHWGAERDRQAAVAAHNAAVAKDLLVGAAPLEDRIRAAYREVLTEQGRANELDRPGTGGWVKLNWLRAKLPEVPRVDLDRALDKLIEDPEVTLMHELNQASLTDADRDAAVDIGGEPRHVMRIERRS